MTTPKNKVVPGTVVVITNVTMGEKLFDNKVPVILTGKPGSVFETSITPNLGEEVEILSTPKKYDGINVVKVKYKEEEYFTYYCSIRFMTKVKE